LNLADNYEADIIQGDMKKLSNWALVAVAQNCATTLLPKTSPNAD